MNYCHNPFCLKYKHPHPVYCHQDLTKNYSADRIEVVSISLIKLVNIDSLILIVLR